MRSGRLDNESDDYRALRDELQEAERALRDQREAVAALRRRLPRNEVIEDQQFEELVDGTIQPVKLSQLFDDPQKPLLLMHFMHGKQQEKPCPMCSLWADGYNSVQRHIRQRANFALLIAGDLPGFTAWAEERGWRELRIVSAADSDLKSRLGFETPDGSQLPGISVFERRASGELAHFYSQSAMLAEGENRGMDLLSPVWNYFDLTPEGRGDFMPRGYYAKGEGPSD